MAFAYPLQKIQDWMTQQWVIFRGRKIEPEQYAWLVGPFGNLQSIDQDFFNQLAAKEDLIIERNKGSKGLIPVMAKLNLPPADFALLSPEVIAFYENTSNYDLKFSVKWNFFFKFFGLMLSKLFSNRINQLNIPTKSIDDGDSLNSEIIVLKSPLSGEIKYTFWYRSIKSSGQVIYCGAYGICTLPSGKSCVKAVFPLPNGNATVILNPLVGKNGELILDSTGRNFGDAGFYFLLQDSKGKLWSQFISSFRDRLVIGTEKDYLSAERILTLWGLKVLTFNYKIMLKTAP